jgi:histone-arginine methyltransferase CARM1
MAVKVNNFLLSRFHSKLKKYLELLVFHDALKKLSAQKSDANTSHNNSKEIPAKRKRTASKSEFDQRTEESSAQAYFQFYGFLSQQQNMLQDYSRTSTYQKAILENSIDFHNKVI